MLVFSMAVVMEMGTEGVGVLLVGSGWHLDKEG